MLFWGKFLTLYLLRLRQKKCQPKQILFSSQKIKLSQSTTFFFKVDAPFKYYPSLNPKVSDVKTENFENSLK